MLIFVYFTNITETECRIMHLSDFINARKLCVDESRLSRIIALEPETVCLPFN